ncbi:MAG: outer membrane beta-barrel protein [Cognaticolwellia sp.]
MDKKILLGALLFSALTSNASANWQAGVSFGRFTEKSYNQDIDLDIVSFSLSYQIDLKNNWKLAPELKIGQGVGNFRTDKSFYLEALENFTDLSLVNAEVEIDRFIEAGLKLEYHFSSGFYSYLNASYADIDISTRGNSSAASFSFSRGNQDEFGLGVGIGYQLTKVLKTDVNFQRFGSDDLLSASLKYSF